MEASGNLGINMNQSNQSVGMPGALNVNNTPTNATVTGASGQSSAASQDAQTAPKNDMGPLAQAMQKSPAAKPAQGDVNAASVKKVDDSATKAGTQGTNEVKTASENNLKPEDLKAVEMSLADLTPKEQAKQAEVATNSNDSAGSVASGAPVGLGVAVAGGAALTSAGQQVAIESLLEECIRNNASDLHIQAGLPPYLRIDGTLRPIPGYPVLSDDMIQKLVFSTLDESQQKILIKDKEFDYSFAFGDLGRFRVNAFHEKGNMAAAFRLIPNVIRTIEELGMPGVVETFANYPNGLVLVTGPTGSGKTTTLAALIDKINAERADHIITIEDPIEFTYTSKMSVVAQREVHYDTYSFAAALRSILREDPDVVLIGEMRDLETIQAAITVAETGHLVFATLHTNSAAQSIDRMVDVFPAHQQPQIRTQLANILVGICSQRLVPTIEGGRVALAEIMIANSAVRSIIREGKTHQLDMTIQTGAEQGMQTMDRELAKAVKSGIVSFDTARQFAVDMTEFERLARG